MVFNIALTRPIRAAMVFHAEPKFRAPATLCLNTAPVCADLATPYPDAEAWFPVAAAVTGMFVAGVPAPAEKMHVLGVDCRSATAAEPFQYRI